MIQLHQMVVQCSMMCFWQMQQDKSSNNAERAIVRPVSVTPVNLIFITIVCARVCCSQRNIICIVKVTWWIKRNPLITLIMVLQIDKPCKRSWKWRRIIKQKSTSFRPYSNSKWMLENTNDDSDLVLEPRILANPLLMMQLCATNFEPSLFCCGTRRFLSLGSLFSSSLPFVLYYVLRLVLSNFET